MKRAHWFYLPSALAVAAAATWGPFGPQVLVLCLTFGIFLGTVSLSGPRAGSKTIGAPTAQPTTPQGY